MERKWEVLPDARDWEIQRLREAVQERDGVIEVILLRELRLREALEWYGEQARLARLIHSEGDKGRNALAADGGEKARAALATGGKP